MADQDFQGVESGGSDSMDLAPNAPYPVGVELPGYAFVTQGQIMQDMAQPEAIMDNYVGLEGSDGVGGPENSRTAGITVTGGEPMSGVPQSGLVAMPDLAGSSQQGSDSPNDGSYWANL